LNCGPEQIQSEIALVKSISMPDDRVSVLSGQVQKKAGRNKNVLKQLPENVHLP
jgi:hypothetical protein